jgi:hypothetical protein
VSFNNFSIKNIFNKKSWDPLPSGDGQKLSLRVQVTDVPIVPITFHLLNPGSAVKKGIHLQLVFIVPSTLTPMIPIQELIVKEPEILLT